MKPSTRAFYECRRHQRPLVIVRHEEGKSLVSWDLITIPNELDQFINEHSDSFMDEIKGLMYEMDIQKTGIIGTCFAGEVQNVEPAKVEEFAAGIYECLEKLLTWAEKELNEPYRDEDD